MEVEARGAGAHDAETGARGAEADVHDSETEVRRAEAEEKGALPDSRCGGDWSEVGGGGVAMAGWKVAGFVIEIQLRGG